jgi:hypothetical protein
LNNIDFIVGAEINAVMNDTECHILAYNFDTQNKSLRELMRHNRSILIDKGGKLIEEMSKQPEYRGIISMREFLKYERDKKNGGWDSIDYLKSKNLVQNWPDYREFARKYPVDLDKDFLPAEEVIKIIHDAGGYAVLAHPGDNTLEMCEISAPQLLEFGIDGFECYYPVHTNEITDFHVKFCREHDLIITSGSDEHGNFGDKHIGTIKIKIEQLNLKDMI